MDDSAGHVVHTCVEAVESLVESLLQGHVELGHLQTCLKYRDQFKKLYRQCTDTHRLLWSLLNFPPTEVKCVN